jgi:hypothetical protein
MKSPKLVKLPSLKGIPQQIEWVLRYVRASEKLGDTERWPFIWKMLGPKLQSLSLHRAPPKVENLISAQALPTSYRLGLIEGGKTRWSTTYVGRRLLDVVDYDERYRLRLAKVILDKDSEGWYVVQSLKSVLRHPGAAVQIPDLVLALARNGIDAMEGLDNLSPQVVGMLAQSGITYQTSSCRLSDMLQYFDWVDLVRHRKSSVTLSIARVEEALHEAIEDPEGSIPLSDFFNAVLRHYRRLSKTTYASPFVPLRPILMDTVCDELHIGPTHFARLLSQLPTEFGGYQMLLSPYRARRDPYEVVQIGKRQFYYISLYPVGDQREEQR